MSGDLKLRCWLIVAARNHHFTPPSSSSANVDEPFDDMMTETLHQEALRRLCFSCKKMFKPKEQITEVEKYLVVISKAMGCDIFTMDGVTPSHICNSCKLKFNHLASGKTITTSHSLTDWEACGENCGTCEYMIKQKKGGSHKKVSGIYIFVLFRENPHLFFNIVRKSFTTPTPPPPKTMKILWFLELMFSRKFILILLRSVQNMSSF